MRRSLTLFLLPIILLVTSCTPSREAEWNTATTAGKQAVIAGNFREAVAQYNKALEAIRTVEPQDKRLADTMDQLAEAHVGAGDLNEAEQLYREVLPLQRQFYGSDSEQVANTLHNLGTLYQDVDRMDEAEASYKEALVMREKVLGKNHPDYATTLLHLGSLRAQLDQTVEAERLDKEALAICQSTKQQRCVATIYDNLGELYFAKGRIPEAIDVYSKGREAWKALAGTEHIDYAISTANLARVYQQQKKYKEAEALLKESLPIFEMTYGDRSAELVGYYRGYAQLLRNLNREDEGEAYDRKATAIQALTTPKQ